MRDSGNLGDLFENKFFPKNKITFLGIVGYVIYTVWQIKIKEKIQRSMKNQELSHQTE